MKRLILLSSLVLLAGTAAAQEALKVTYGTPGRGGRPSPMKTVLTISGQENKIGREIDTAAMLRQNPEMAERMRSQSGRGAQVSETQYIDYGKMVYYSVAELPGGEVIATEVPFALDTELTIEPSDTVICGYRTKVATAIINSNTIKYWFTEDAGAMGTIQPAANLPRGLVLMTSRNGNIGMKAEKVEKIPSPGRLIPAAFTAVVDAPMYRYRVNNAGVITVPVFDNQHIGFKQVDKPASVSALQPDMVYTVGGGTVILKKVKLPESAAGWNIFAKVTEKSDKDAYDRIGSVFVIPTDRELSFLDALIGGINTVPAFTDSQGKAFPGIIATDNYRTPVELVRFATPFGVGGYNYHQVPGQQWADSVIYHQDVTHLAPLLQGEVWIGAYIGNWVEDGHKLSLTLKYHPGGRGSQGRTVIPVFNSLNIMEQDGQDYPAFMRNDALQVKVNVPQDVKGAQLVYLTTGHGGWGGGDEFNQKVNTISMDGRLVHSFIPWREDCATYRDWNPASGNFSNGLSSSDLSRSNWCPGTVVNPVYIPLGDLPAGEHTFAVSIFQGEPQGNSFSYWCLSGVIIGETE